MMRVLSGALVLVDQALWSVTNFSAMVALAHTLPTATFGVVGVTYGIIVVASGSVVAMAAESLAVGRGLALKRDPFTDVEPLVWRACFLAGILGLGYAVMSTTAAIYAFSVTFLSDAVILLLLGSPFLLFAESVRAILYASRDLTGGRIVTLSWLAAQLPGLSFAWVLGGDPVYIVASWITGALLAVSAGVIRLFRLRLAPPARPMLTKRSFAYLLEYWATSAPSQLFSVLAGATVGLQGAGQLRALQTVFGPLNVVVAAIRNVIIPAATQTLSGRSLGRRGVAVASGTTVATLVVGSVVLIPGLGSAIMGGAWPESAVLVLGFVMTRVSFALSMGALVISRGEGRTATSLLYRCAYGVSTLVGFWIGAVRFGLAEALWLSSTCSALMGLVWFIHVYVGATIAENRKSAQLAR